MAYPNPELIDALRRTADKIESGEWDNQWGTPSQCNCGLLARSILGEPLRFSKRMGSWQKAPQENKWLFGEPKCQSTGLSFSEITDILKGIGLRDEDLAHLELLDNEAVVEAMDTSRFRYNSDNHVVEYLRTWADLLEKARPLADETGESTAKTAERPEADPIPA